MKSPAEDPSGDHHPSSKAQHIPLHFRFHAGEYLDISQQSETSSVPTTDGVVVSCADSFLEALERENCQIETSPDGLWTAVLLVDHLRIERASPSLSLNVSVSATVSDDEEPRLCELPTELTTRPAHRLMRWMLNSEVLLVVDGAAEMVYLFSARAELLTVVERRSLTSSGFSLQMTNNPVVSVIPLAKAGVSQCGFALLHEDTSLQVVWLSESEDELLFEVKDSLFIDRSLAVEQALYLPQQSVLLFVAAPQREKTSMSDRREREAVLVSVSLSLSQREDALSIDKSSLSRVEVSRSAQSTRGEDESGQDIASSWLRSLSLNSKSALPAYRHFPVKQILANNAQNLLLLLHGDGAVSLFSLKNQKLYLCEDRLALPLSSTESPHCLQFVGEDLLLSLSSRGDSQLLRLSTHAETEKEFSLHRESGSESLFPQSLGRCLTSAVFLSSSFSALCVVSILRRIDTHTVQFFSATRISPRDAVRAMLCETEQREPSAVLEDALSVARRPENNLSEDFVRKSFHCEIVRKTPHPTAAVDTLIADNLAAIEDDLFVLREALSLARHSQGYDLDLVLRVLDIALLRCESPLLHLLDIETDEVVSEKERLLLSTRLCLLTLRRTAALAVRVLRAEEEKESLAEFLRLTAALGDSPTQSHRKRIGEEGRVNCSLPIALQNDRSSNALLALQRDLHTIQTEVLCDNEGESVTERVMEVCILQCSPLVWVSLCARRGLTRELQSFLSLYAESVVCSESDLESVLCVLPSSLPPDEWFSALCGTLYLCESHNAATTSTAAPLAVSLSLSFSHTVRDKDALLERDIVDQSRLKNIALAHIENLYRHSNTAVDSADHAIDTNKKESESFLEKAVLLCAEHSLHLSRSHSANAPDSFTVEAAVRILLRRVIALDRCGQSFHALSLISLLCTSLSAAEQEKEREEEKKKETYSLVQENEPSKQRDDESASWDIDIDFDSDSDGDNIDDRNNNSNGANSTHDKEFHTLFLAAQALQRECERYCELTSRDALPLTHSITQWVLSPISYRVKQCVSAALCGIAEKRVSVENVCELFHDVLRDCCEVRGREDIERARNLLYSLSITDEDPHTIAVLTAECSALSSFSPPHKQSVDAEENEKDFETQIVSALLSFLQENCDLERLQIVVRITLHALFHSSLGRAEYTFLSLENAAELILRALLCFDEVNLRDTESVFSLCEACLDTLSPLLIDKNIASLHSVRNLHDFLQLLLVLRRYWQGEESENGGGRDTEWFFSFVALAPRLAAQTVSRDRWPSLRAQRMRWHSTLAAESALFVKVFCERENERRVGRETDTAQAKKSLSFFQCLACALVDRFLQSDSSLSLAHWPILAEDLLSLQRHAQAVENINTGSDSSLSQEWVFSLLLDSLWNYAPDSLVRELNKILLHDSPPAMAQRSVTEKEKEIKRDTKKEKEKENNPALCSAQLLEKLSFSPRMRECWLQIVIAAPLRTIAERRPTTLSTLCGALSAESLNLLERVSASTAAERQWWMCVSALCVVELASRLPLSMQSEIERVHSLAEAMDFLRSALVSVPALFAFKELKVDSARVQGNDNVERLLRAIEESDDDHEGEDLLFSQSLSLLRPLSLLVLARQRLQSLSYSLSVEKRHRSEAPRECVAWVQHVRATALSLSAALLEHTLSLSQWKDALRLSVLLLQPVQWDALSVLGERESERERERVAQIVQLALSLSREECAIERETQRLSALFMHMGEQSQRVRKDEEIKEKEENTSVLREKTKIALLLVSPAHALFEEAEAEKTPTFSAVHRKNGKEGEEEDDVHFIRAAELLREMVSNELAPFVAPSLPPPSSSSISTISSVSTVIAAIKDASSSSCSLVCARSWSRLAQAQILLHLQSTRDAQQATDLLMRTLKDLHRTLQRARERESERDEENVAAQWDAFFRAREDALQRLQQQGFSLAAAKKALWFTRDEVKGKEGGGEKEKESSSFAAALRWAVMHAGEKDFDHPLVLHTPAAAKKDTHTLLDRDGGREGVIFSTAQVLHALELVNELYTSLCGSPPPEMERETPSISPVTVSTITVPQNAQLTLQTHAQKPKRELVAKRDSAKKSIVAKRLSSSSEDFAFADSLSAENSSLNVAALTPTTLTPVSEHIGADSNNAINSSASATVSADDKVLRESACTSNGNGKTDFFSGYIEGSTATAVNTATACSDEFTGSANVENNASKADFNAETFSPAAAINSANPAPIVSSPLSPTTPFIALRDDKEQQELEEKDKTTALVSTALFSSPKERAEELVDSDAWRDDSLEALLQSTGSPLNQSHNNNESFNEESAAWGDTSSLLDLSLSPSPLYSRAQHISLCGAEDGLSSLGLGEDLSLSVSTQLREGEEEEQDRREDEQLMRVLADTLSHAHSHTHSHAHAREEATPQARLSQEGEEALMILTETRDEERTPQPVNVQKTLFATPSLCERESITFFSRSPSQQSLSLSLSMRNEEDSAALNESFCQSLPVSLGESTRLIAQQPSLSLSHTVGQREEAASDEREFDGQLSVMSDVMSESMCENRNGDWENAVHVDEHTERKEDGEDSEAESLYAVYKEDSQFSHENSMLTQQALLHAQQESVSAKDMHEREVGGVSADGNAQDVRSDTEETNVSRTHIAGTKNDSHTETQSAWDVDIDMDEDNEIEAERDSVAVPEPPSQTLAVHNETGKETASGWGDDIDLDIDSDNEEEREKEKVVNKEEEERENKVEFDRENCSLLCEETQESNDDNVLSLTHTECVEENLMHTQHEVLKDLHADDLHPESLTVPQRESAWDVDVDLDVDSESDGESETARANVVVVEPSSLSLAAYNNETEKETMREAERERDWGDHVDLEIESDREEERGKERSQVVCVEEEQRQSNTERETETEKSHLLEKETAREKVSEPSGAVESRESSQLYAVYEDHSQFSEENLMFTHPTHHTEKENTSKTVFENTVCESESERSIPFAEENDRTDSYTETHSKIHTDTHRDAHTETAWDIEIDLDESSDGKSEGKSTHAVLNGSVCEKETEKQALCVEEETVQCEIEEEKQGPVEGEASQLCEEENYKTTLFPSEEPQTLLAHSYEDVSLTDMSQRETVLCDADEISRHDTEAQPKAHSKSVWDVDIDVDADSESEMERNIEKDESKTVVVKPHESFSELEMEAVRETERGCNDDIDIDIDVDSVRGSEIEENKGNNSILFEESERLEAEESGDNRALSHSVYVEESFVDTQQKTVQEPLPHATIAQEEDHTMNIQTEMSTKNAWDVDIDLGLDDGSESADAAALPMNDDSLIRQTERETERDIFGWADDDLSVDSAENNHDKSHGINSDGNGVAHTERETEREATVHGNIPNEEKERAKDIFGWGDDDFSVDSDASNGNGGNANDGNVSIPVIDSEREILGECVAQRETERARNIVVSNTELSHLTHTESEKEIDRESESESGSGTVSDDWEDDWGDDAASIDSRLSLTHTDTLIATRQHTEEDQQTVNEELQIETQRQREKDIKRERRGAWARVFSLLRHASLLQSLSFSDTLSLWADNDNNEEDDNLDEYSSIFDVDAALLGDEAVREHTQDVLEDVVSAAAVSTDREMVRFLYDELLPAIANAPSLELAVLLLARLSVKEEVTVTDGAAMLQELRFQCVSLRLRRAVSVSMLDLDTAFTDTLVAENERAMILLLSLHKSVLPAQTAAVLLLKQTVLILLQRSSFTEQSIRALTHCESDLSFPRTVEVLEEEISILQNLRSVPRCEGVSAHKLLHSDKLLPYSEWSVAGVEGHLSVIEEVSRFLCEESLAHWQKTLSPRISLTESDLRLLLSLHTLGSREKGAQKAVHSLSFSAHTPRELLVIAFISVSLPLSLFPGLRCLTQREIEPKQTTLSPFPLLLPESLLRPLRDLNVERLHVLLSSLENALRSLTNQEEIKVLVVVSNPLQELCWPLSRLQTVRALQKDMHGWFSLLSSLQSSWKEGEAMKETQLACSAAEAWLSRVVVDVRIDNTVCVDLALFVSSFLETFTQTQREKTLDVSNVLRSRFAELLHLDTHNSLSLRCVEQSCVLLSRVSELLANDEKGKIIFLSHSADALFCALRETRKTITREEQENKEKEREDESVCERDWQSLLDSVPARLSPQSERARAIVCLGETLACWQRVAAECMSHTSLQNLSLQLSATALRSYCLEICTSVVKRDTENSNEMVFSSEGHEVEEVLDSLSSLKGTNDQVIAVRAALSLYRQRHATEQKDRSESFAVAQSVLLSQRLFSLSNMSDTSQPNFDEVVQSRSNERDEDGAVLLSLAQWMLDLDLAEDLVEFLCVDLSLHSSAHVLMQRIAAHCVLSEKTNKTCRRLFDFIVHYSETALQQIESELAYCEKEEQTLFAFAAVFHPQLSLAALADTPRLFAASVALLNSIHSATRANRVGKAFLSHGDEVVITPPNAVVRELRAEQCLSPSQLPLSLSLSVARRLPSVPLLCAVLVLREKTQQAVHCHWATSRRGASVAHFVFSTALTVLRKKLTAQMSVERNEAVKTVFRKAVEKLATFFK